MGRCVWFKRRQQNKEERVTLILRRNTDNQKRRRDRTARGERGDGGHGAGVRQEARGAGGRARAWVVRR